MRYEYHTEALSLPVVQVGRRGSTQLEESGDVTEIIQRRFNELASEGWEFMQIGDIPVTGQTLKSGVHRVVSVAVFRRPLDF